MTKQTDPDGEIDWRRVMYNAPLDTRAVEVKEKPEVGIPTGEEDPLPDDTPKD